MLNIGAAVKTINTVLRIAAKLGNLEIPKLAIEHGAELDESNQHGGTPLVLAITERRKEIIQLLLSKGVDVNLCNGIGLTPLLIAAAHRNEKKLLGGFFREEQMSIREATLRCLR